MVKDFSQRESERVAQEAKAAKGRAEADQRAKAHATELEQKIADRIKQKDIHAVEHGINEHDNSILLRRSAGTLEISFREIGSRELMTQEWQYSLYRKRSGGGSSLERTADNQDLDRLNEDQMEDAVMDWLSEK